MEQPPAGQAERRIRRRAAETATEAAANGQSGGNGGNGTGTGGSTRGLRWDPTDPLQRHARYSLHTGIWALFFSLFSLPEVALLLGALSLYWGINALRGGKSPSRSGEFGQAGPWRIRLRGDGGGRRGQRPYDGTRRTGRGRLPRFPSA